MNRKYLTEIEKRDALQTQRSVKNLKQSLKRKENREKYLKEKKEHYERRKQDEAWAQKQSEFRQNKYLENFEYCEKYKEIVGCKFCGYKKTARALSFHHRISEVKKFTISDSYSGQSLGAIKLEIEKCDVLCQNCHIRLHYEYGWKEKYLEQNRGALVRKREFCNRYKTMLGCKYCGCKETECLQFHHIDPREKFLAISVMYKRKFEFLAEEIKKCEVFCANCHMEFHDKN